MTDGPQPAGQKPGKAPLAAGTETAKHILWIHYGEGLGGASKSLADLIRAIPSVYQKTLLTSGPGLKGFFEAVGAQVFMEPRLSQWQVGAGWYHLWEVHRWLPDVVRFPFTVLVTYRWVKKFRPSLVHLNSSSLAPCAIGARLAGAKIVWHIREPMLRGYFGLRRRLARWLIGSQSDVVVAISEEDKRLVGDQWRSKIEVVYDWPDDEDITPPERPESVRRRLGLPLQGPVVVYVGGAQRIKGITILLSAIEAVLKVRPDVRFILGGCLEPPGGLVRKVARSILGWMSSTANLRALLARYPQAARASAILAYQRDVASLIAASDFLVFPSTVQHFARPVAEAAALGKTSVASDFGETCEIIQQGVTGLLIPPNDPHALARAILFLLADPERCYRMGFRARTEALDRFDKQKNVKHLLDIYSHVLGEPGMQLGKAKEEAPR